MSRTSNIWQVIPGDSVHLPAALQSETNVSYMANSWRFGSLTLCVAKRAKRQPLGRKYWQLAHLPAAFQSEMHVSHTASNSRRFGSLTSCMAERAECQRYGEQLLEIRFTCQLYWREPNVSNASNSRRFGSRTVSLQNEPNDSDVASGSRRLGSRTLCIAKRALRQQYGEQLPAIRFTYRLIAKRAERQ